jgi:hypothetical protein
MTTMYWTLTDAPDQKRPVPYFSHLNLACRLEA